jgi:chemotaxis protein methyltransferase CheR
MACSDSDYTYLRNLVLAQSSNLVDPSRNALFDTRLTPMARLAGVTNLEEFVGVLRKDTQSHLHRAVAETMTINETSFFRDRLPFEMLRKTVFPELIARRRGQRRLRIWSAASSTGQEVYSIAMLLCEHFPEVADWDVKIVGTDLSREVIEVARAGRYRRIDVNRGLPVLMLMKYLRRDGEMWEMCSRARAMCEFQQLNLCAELASSPEPSGFPELPEFDLVLLRNVLLYFSQQDRSRVFGKVRQQMAGDGYLLLGNAEQAEDSTKLFTVEFAAGCYVYRLANTT